MIVLSSLPCRDSFVACSLALTKSCESRRLLPFGAFSFNINCRELAVNCSLIGIGEHESLESAVEHGLLGFD